uniref:Uncharacterized protein n=1 Tax=Megaselia scalaris TaxID=36166 RepID=T1GA27_MEGSC
MNGLIEAFQHLRTVTNRASIPTATSSSYSTIFNWICWHASDPYNSAGSQGYQLDRFGRTSPPFQLFVFLKETFSILRKEDRKAGMKASRQDNGRGTHPTERSKYRT